MGDSLKKNTILLISTNRGQLYVGAKKEGYNIANPYIEHNIIERVLREICFRVKFLPKKVWYNRKILDIKPEKVVVWDALITADYLRWLHVKLPNAQLNFLYGNMVGKAKHIMPHEIPFCYRQWTYDNYDSQKYGIRQYKTDSYMLSYLKAKEDVVYDVLFVGKDKGRGNYLLELESKMRSMGLITKFIIAPDGRLSRKKSYYQKPIPYEEIVNLIVKSKSILNVAMDNQQGITVRDMESVFFEVKLLTTNKYIKNSEFYNPNNVYIIEGTKIDDLPDFLSKPLIPVPDEVKEKHTFDCFIEELTGD